MRGEESETQQVQFGFCAGDMVPRDHPIRGIKFFVEKALAKLKPELNAMYSENGRPSIPPETLLKSLLLMALYTVRSERQFCEMLRYNLLFQWFLNRGVMEAGFAPTVFTKNRDRLLEHDIARKFFESITEHLKAERLMDSEHFTVDGTLIKAWASLKSLEKRDDDDISKRSQGKKPSRVGVNDKYVSSTDPEATVASKPGVSARLAYSGNILIENRNGLIADVEFMSATGTAEPEAALNMIGRALKSGFRVKTLGADANYFRQEFITRLRRNNIKPHVAPHGDRTYSGIDNRTFNSAGYKTSQKFRKRIEKIFGWFKIGSWNQTKYRGTNRVSLLGILSAAAYNIIRSLKLKPSLGTI